MKHCKIHMSLHSYCCKKYNYLLSGDILYAQQFIRDRTPHIFHSNRVIYNLEFQEYTNCCLFSQILLCMIYTYLMLLHFMNRSLKRRYGKYYVLMYIQYYNQCMYQLWRYFSLCNLLPLNDICDELNSSYSCKVSTFHWDSMSNNFWSLYNTCYSQVHVQFYRTHIFLLQLDHMNCNW